MLGKIFIFIIFLGPLIFFHELGHFLFARLFGVRVEVFSLGFGPKLFKFVRGGTEYGISLIPLGGYVKMFGDDPFGGEAIPESQKKYAFNHKGKWARFWIVFGGPLANFILAFFIFFFLVLAGEKVPLAQMGMVPKDSLLGQKGLRPGDIIRKMNQVEIIGMTDLALDENEVVKTINVERNGQGSDIFLDMTFKQFMGEYFKYLPHFRKPIVVDKRGNQLGITRTQGTLLWDVSLEKLSETPSTKLYLYKLKRDGAPPSQEEGPATPPEVDYSQEEILEMGNLSTPQEFYSRLRTLGYFPLDLRVASVLKDSPAEKGRLKEGDLIISIGGRPISSFDELRHALQSLPSQRPAKLEYVRHTMIETAAIMPESDGQGENKVLQIGVYSAGEFLPISYRETEGRGVGEGLVLAWERTWDSIVKTMVGFKKLITQEVSFKSIGGPLAIGKVASDSFQISLSYFFKLMAFISINLGIINLFPIPVLDGGHIFFLALEIINRGPLSRKKLELAQQFGVSLLFLLIFAALFNDVSRLFGN